MRLAHYGIATLTVAWMAIAPKASAVAWHTQAERLQDVSAAFLDGLPLGEPVHDELGVEAKTVVSFLPKPNSTIGGKKESVPKAPVHATPQLEVHGGPAAGSDFAWLKGRAWIGYKPDGGESLLGLKAKLNQFVVGAAAVPEWALDGFNLFLSLGYQHTTATVVGAITTPAANDRFEQHTDFYYLAPGVRFPTLNLWANALIGLKRTNTNFHIQVDGTRFQLDDNPPAMQVAAGWYHPCGIELGVAELWIRERVLMPRLLLAYDYSFD